MNTSQVIFNGQLRIVCIFNAIENIHIYEPAKDWDEEVEEDKEKVDTLNKEEDICQNNKEDSEEKCPLVEETLVYWKNEEENFPKDEDEKYPEDENMDGKNEGEDFFEEEEVSKHKDENKIEEDKEEENTLNKEEENFQNNKGDTEERSSLVEETLLDRKNEEDNFPKDEDEKYPEDENMSKVEEEYSNKEEDMEASKVFNYKQRWGKTKLKYFLGIMIHWMVNILLLCPILITGKS